MVVGLTDENSVYLFMSRVYVLVQWWQPTRLPFGLVVMCSKPLRDGDLKSEHVLHFDEGVVFRGVNCEWSIFRCWLSHGLCSKSEKYVLVCCLLDLSQQHIAPFSTP